MQNVSICQSISTASPYPIRYQLSVCMYVCMYGCLLPKFEGVLICLFIIELAYENQKLKYNIQ